MKLFCRRLSSNLFLFTDNLSSVLAGGLFATILLLFSKDALLALAIKSRIFITTGSLSKFEELTARVGEDELPPVMPAKTLISF